MMGIAANPAKLTIALRVLPGNFVRFFISLLVIAHKRFIVYPGIATDANNCHINVSVPTRAVCPMSCFR